ncbi:hypothetical protein DES40_1958 [Litorimonas taeanensis]|uniref:Uncharacterized protein n=1 Tax=Litorimonas taeanensis TaxID=568099 RepID=A0A420WDT2_9PROT|nr:hypothetical protein [Litorimonas taeanensis]RKQ69171.1 hypothetical protein DES40_1958 [Litorimonas taeanensis]
MTFRTLDIDTAIETPDVTAMSSSPARTTRSRRHASVMSRRSYGCRVVGFGF